MTRSLEQAALRCLLPGFEGTEAPEWVLRRAAEGLGGVCLYARNIQSPDQLARLCARLHAENPGLIIAIDEEGGDVTRLEAATGSSYPGNLALGAADNVGITFVVARQIGLELARAGVDLDLAPDADVNSNPSNPVIGVRSFGSDPAAVAAQTVAWVGGLQSAGVAACVKHFPGHGDTSVDSHVALPVVGADPHASGALQPFAAAIKAGVKAVMSAHIRVTSMDDAPATLSRRIMTGLLRDELGFQGLTVTDGIEMKAIPDVAQGSVRALEAGCDLVCIGGGLADEDVVTQLQRAIASAVPAERLQEAAGRVDALAAWRATQSVQEPPNPAAGLAAARLALRVDGNVQVGDDVVVVQLVPHSSMASGVIPWGVAGPLAERGARVTTFEHRDGPADLVPDLEAARGRSLVLTVRNLHRHEWQQAAADRLLRARPDAVVVEMGLPGCRPAAAAAYIATSGAARVCAIAAAEVMRP
ncbi:MAG TPA: glycoside hydrolase family 3 protein [Candidatus Dormibacteraeota bacterium]|nr:glycoside hydrolase family 3 protein [Candidatus Dormibacteraeota bacterium]